MAAEVADAQPTPSPTAPPTAPAGGGGSTQGTSPSGPGGSTQPSGAPPPSGSETVAPGDAGASPDQRPPVPYSTFKRERSNFNRKIRDLESRIASASEWEGKYG